MLSPIGKAVIIGAFAIALLGIALSQAVEQREINNLLPEQRIVVVTPAVTPTAVPLPTATPSAILRNPVNITKPLTK